MASRRGVDPAGFQHTGAVNYPSLPGPASESSQGYAAYPEVAEVSQSPPATQQTELFMDHYSDVSRYPIPCNALLPSWQRLTRILVTALASKRCSPGSFHARSLAAGNVFPGS